jgi:hypothetical protein
VAHAQTMMTAAWIFYFVFLTRAQCFKQARKLTMQDFETKTGRDMVMEALG